MNQGEFQKIQDYILQLGTKLADGTPLFSARHFAGMIDEASKEFSEWSNNEPSIESGYILQASTEQRSELLKESYTSWVQEGKGLILKWFGSP